MTFATPSGGPIRWEAQSHATIYHQTHTPASGPAHPLAATVSLWQEIAADLGEIRSRYDAALCRLTEANTGESTEAAGAGARLITRGLTEAQELARLAGAQRARLLELNGELRESMPEPVQPVEHGSEFLDRGLGWLNAPNFVEADAKRLNAEEIARDLMRAYEESITSEALAENAHRPAGPPDDADPGHDGPTRPLSVHLVEPGVHPAGHDLLPGGGQFALVSPAPVSTGYVWSYADFGPEGHTEEDAGADDEEEESGRAAGGAAAPVRHYAAEWTAQRRISADLFDLNNIHGSPPVIGE